MRKLRERLCTAHDQFRSTKPRVQAALERAELLRGAPQRAESEDSTTTVAMDELMRERGHIDGAGAYADTVMEQALAARDLLEQQRGRVAQSRGKLGHFGGVVESTRKVMERIGWKKRKNAIVLGTVIALCLFFLFWWWVSG